MSHPARVVRRRLTVIPVPKSGGAGRVTTVRLFAFGNVQLFCALFVLLCVRRRLTMFVFNTQTHCYGVFECSVFRAQCSFFSLKSSKCSRAMEHFSFVQSRHRWHPLIMFYAYQNLSYLI